MTTLHDLASHWLRRLDEDEGCGMMTHWEGCESEHMRCAIRRFAEGEVEQAEVRRRLGVNALNPAPGESCTVKWTSPHGASITEPIP